MAARWSAAFSLSDRSAEVAWYFVRARRSDALFVILMAARPMSEFQLEPGVVMAGKYRIDRVLGRGGMGVVAAAYHLQLEQFVALKLMLPQALGNHEAVGRFLREARAAARISSEHVARVFDVGALATGEPYIRAE